MSANRKAVLILDGSEAPHAPTSESRRLVACMVACGLDEQQIAFCLKCSPYEVKFHYPDELKHGAAMANAEVGAALFRNAIGGDTQAQKFWLMTRAGWQPPTPEEAKKNQANQQLTQQKRAMMNEIVELMARDKDKVEAGNLASKTNPQESAS